MQSLRKLVSGMALATGRVASNQDWEKAITGDKDVHLCAGFFCQLFFWKICPYQRLPGITLERIIRTGNSRRSTVVQPADAMQRRFQQICLWRKNRQSQTYELEKEYNAARDYPRPAPEARGFFANELSSGPDSTVGGDGRPAIMFIIASCHRALQIDHADENATTRNTRPAHEQNVREIIARLCFSIATTFFDLRQLLRCITPGLDSRVPNRAEHPCSVTGRGLRHRSRAIPRNSRDRNRNANSPQRPARQ